MTPEHAEQAKAAGDILSIGVMLSALADVLPSIAALLTIVWTLIRIVETDTMRGIVAKIWGKK